ncbi:MAG: hypothetical protein C0421_00820 [Hyphomonas sp.]|nr:hypothetical protein [Hyphomonas sp.]
MVLQTAGAIDTLFGIVMSFGTSHARLEKEEDDLSKKLARARTDKELKLDEFRNGLFCSGCNQTKSEILAKGETFPHSGQSILRATTEQIAAKERELNDIISKLATTLESAVKKLADARERIDEACDQIISGCGLFSTSLFFWNSTVVNYERETSGAFIRDREAAFQAASDAVKQGDLAKTSKDVRAAIDQLTLWQDLIRDMDKAQTDRWRAVQQSLTQMSEQGRNKYKSLAAEENRITHALGVTEVASKFASAATYIHQGAGQSFNGVTFGQAGKEGLYFRMGDATPSRRGEILSSVRNFTDDYVAIKTTLGLRFQNAPKFENDPFRQEKDQLLRKENELVLREFIARTEG